MSFARFSYFSFSLLKPVFVPCFRSVCTPFRGFSSISEDAKPIMKPKVTIIESKETTKEKVAVAKRGFIKGSVKKLRPLLFRVVNLPVDEALLQMNNHMKFRRALEIAKVIQSAKTTAINTYGMDPKRLYVAEALCGRDMALKRMIFHARGKTGVLQHRFSNLVIRVKEWPEGKMNVHMGRTGTLTETRIAKRTLERERRESWLQTLRAKGEAAKLKKIEDRKLAMTKATPRVEKI